jgi:DNA-binding transcriptional regulator YiaG
MASLPDFSFTFHSATIVGRCGQTRIGSQSFSIGEAPDEGLANQDCRTLHADTANAAKLLDHPASIIRGRHFGHRIALALSIFDPRLRWCVIHCQLEGSTMGQVFHGSATTTEAVRRAIQHSQASLRTLARRYGINQKTVAKWKKRTATADLPTGPKVARSTVLSIEEEAVIVAFRRHTLLPFGRLPLCSAG